MAEMLIIDTSHTTRFPIQTQSASHFMNKV